eukprot:jgi/Tetstr1/464100/TSEL_008905.t1
MESTSPASHSPPPKRGATPDDDADDDDDARLSEEERSALKAFGDDPERFLKAPTLEVLGKTTGLVAPSSSFLVNSYHAAHTQANKLETKGYVGADSDRVCHQKFKVMVYAKHPHMEAARAWLRMEKSGVPPERRMEAEMSRIRESGGDDAAAYAELNNYCLRLQRERRGAGAEKKNAHALSTLIAWKLKSEFAGGTFDFSARDPMVAVDAAYVEALVREPPQGPRKRKPEVRGPRPTGNKRAARSAEASQASSESRGA